MRASVIAGYLAITAVAAFRVASTARLFSATADEPMHLACGLDWLYGRPYTAQPDNPPLARIAAALPFALTRASLPAASADNVGRGNAILYAGDYRRNLARARAGNLLFFAVAILATGAWAARRFGLAGGIAAAALFAWLPPVRAHAGLATTDMAGTASLALSLVAFDRWRELPSIGRGAALGSAAAAGALSKFSFLPFFAAAVAVAAVGGTLRLDRRRRFSAAVAIGIAGLLVWAGYRFEWGTLARADPSAPVWVAMSAPGPVRTDAIQAAARVSVPAPSFFAGAALLAAENAVGHPAYLFGAIREKGWWYYFPVALLFKTPIPFLLLALAGATLALRGGVREREAALLPVAMLATVLLSSIDIGVRHVLPVYAPVSASAGSALVSMARRRDWRVVAAILAVWMAIGTETAHPDYLAWFNEAAGRHPERILEDSNLDWGQDWLRFAATIRAQRLRGCTVFFSGTVRLQQLLAEPGALASGSPDDRRPGWYALPEGVRAMNPARYAWLDDYAFRRIGRSIRLYHVPR